MLSCSFRIVFVAIGHNSVQISFMFENNTICLYLSCYSDFSLFRFEILAAPTILEQIVISVCLLFRFQFVQIQFILCSYCDFSLFRFEFRFQFVQISVDLFLLLFRFYLCLLLLCFLKQKCNDKANWTEANTYVFCELAVEQIRAGNCPNGTMSNRGYKIIAQIFFEKSGL